MTQPWIMGIDLGGSGIRCLLLNRMTEERVVCTSKRWVFPPVPDTFGMGFDIDLELIWQYLGETSRELLQKAGIDPADVASLAVSAVRFGTVILDADNQPLFAVPTKDARAAGECFELIAHCGDALLQDTGCWPLPIHLLPRLLWLKKQHPALFAQAACALSVSDWLNQRLCGVCATDYSQASASGAYNIITRDWCWDKIETLDLPNHIFPPVKASGTVLGQLTADTAKHLGLTTNTIVGLGGGDTQCSLLGDGVIADGEIAAIVGTTAPVQVVANKPLIDSSGRCWSGLHVIPDAWVLESSGGPMGETLTWMARLLFPDAQEPELRLFAEAALAETGAAGMLSTFGAEVMNGKAPTLPSGQFSLSHMTCVDDPNPRRHLARSLIEGYACAIRANIEQIAAVTGADYSTLSLTGGFAQSTIFCQILADICDCHVSPAAQSLTSSIGAAICAAVAAKHYQTFDAAIEHLVTHTVGVMPDSTKTATSRTVYQNWQSLRAAGNETTAPVIFNHILPWVLKPDQPARPIQVKNQLLSALVSAAFDATSLQTMRTMMAVEYANFREVNRLLSGASLVKALQGKQIFVTEVDVVDAKSLAQLPELRVIAACRGNAVNVDVDACTAFGIPVLYAPGRNALAVADLTLGFMLALARKLPAAMTFLKDASVTPGNVGKMGQAFTQLKGHELWQKTIGLIGIGHVGREVAKRLSGFGTRIITADPFATPEQAARAGATLVDLDTLLRESDFVSLHAVVTPETTGMIGRAELAKMKGTAFIINTARAALINEAALIEALQSGKIAGAALDTFNQEPPGADHPLVVHPNVISTPHSAGNTEEVANHQGETISQALAELLRGEKPRCVLNPEVLTGFDWHAPKPQPTSDEIEKLTQRPGPAVTDLDKEAQTKPEPVAFLTANRITASPQIIEKMRDILENFCAAMSADQAVQTFSREQDLTLGFQAQDIGIEFYITLNKGTVQAQLGQPEKGSDVQLSMRAEFLDGMLHGTRDAMSAVMNGDIAFTGDAGKGMAIQHMEADMIRLYSRARERCGDPGNLAAIPLPGGMVKTATPEIIANSDIRQELVNIVNELYDADVITATGGNVSVRNPAGEGELFITPSQVFKGDLCAQLMVRIDMNGKALDAGSKAPSSEKSFHTQILKKKLDANAVVHAHAPHATILANAGLPFLPISSEAAFFGDIPRIPYMTPGSEELAEAVSEAMRDSWAVFMVNHGVVVAGRSLRKAADMVQIIERTAEVILGCYAVGKEPPLLPDESIKNFRAIGDIIA